jgi:calcium-dependent protein kinase
MSGPIWSRVSAEGTDLVKRMLCFDSERRVTAKQALNSEWIVQNTEAQLLEDIVHSEALKNLKEFNSSSKLQQAALTFLTTHMIT